MIPFLSGSASRLKPRSSIVKSLPSTGQSVGTDLKMRPLFCTILGNDRTNGDIEIQSCGRKNNVCLRIKQELQRKFCKLDDSDNVMHCSRAMRSNKAAVTQFPFQFISIQVLDIFIS